MKVNKVTMLGHKDHGKSTLIGSILLATNSISPERINEAKNISLKLNRPFEPGFLLDSFYEERKHGLTIDTTRTQVQYKKFAFELIDVPGHEELIGNMMSGASYAKTAILMVSAKPDEGIKEQSRRHIFLARMFGISNIIVAVNKMDVVNYDKTRFDTIKEHMESFIKKVGYENIAFVPISAYNNENIVKVSEHMRWYGGKTLMDTLVNFSTLQKKNPYDKTCMLLLGALNNDRNTPISSRVLSGKIINATYTMLPDGKKVKITKIISKNKTVKSASTGENPVVYINTPYQKEMKGSVLSNDSKTVKSADAFRSLVFAVNNLKLPLIIKFNGLEAECNNIEIKHIIDLEGIPHIRSNINPLEFGAARIILKKKVPIAPFERIDELGRFTIYSAGKFAGIGIIN